MNFLRRKADRIEKLLILAILLVFLGLILLGRYAYANERRDTQTIQYISKDDERAKYVIGGAILTCVVRIGYRFYKSGYWTWCGDERISEPFPDFGPAVKNAE